MLCLAWKLEAKAMGFFTKAEWLKGMTEIQYALIFTMPLYFICSYTLYSRYEDFFKTLKHPRYTFCNTGRSFSLLCI